MKIEIDYNNILSIIKNYIFENKRYLIALVLLVIVYFTLNQYIRGKIKLTPPQIEKKYSKINLSSDIDTLECKLQQRICFYDNIENSLEKAIENCKDINYCDSF